MNLNDYRCGMPSPEFSQHPYPVICVLPKHHDRDRHLYRLVQDEPTPPPAVAEEPNPNSVVIRIWAHSLNAVVLSCDCGWRKTCHTSNVAEYAATHGFRQHANGYMVENRIRNRETL